jgi:hypothetical protein
MLPLWLAAQNQTELDAAREALQIAIPDLKTEAIRSAIRKGKNARWTEVGTPVQEAEPAQVSTDSVLTSSLKRIWDTQLDRIQTWEPSCPEAAFETPASLWGLLASGSKYRNGIDPQIFAQMASLVRAQQYTGTSFPAGCFALAVLPESDACAQPGPVFRQAASLARKNPQWKVNLRSAFFSEVPFLVCDQSEFGLNGDSPLLQNQPWAIETLISYAGFTGDSSWYRSALLAGDWLLKEKPCANLAITARQVWAMAALYDASGEIRFRDRMLQLSEEMLIPSLLLDENGDGMEDETGIPFAQLHSSARLPGRLWDPVGAISWNTSWVGFALAEAGAALRDRGEVDKSRRLLKAAATVADNLAWELTQQGAPPSGPGFRDMALLFTEGRWRILGKEKKQPALWEQAAAVLWNSGGFRSSADLFPVLGLWLRNRSAGEYQARFSSNRY